jgi:alcohol dehydrogenase YqhD (iron-dependent ADH family)
MTYDVNTPLQDRQAWGYIITLIVIGPKVKADPKDYDSCASLMWYATQALNGVIAAENLDKRGAQDDR